MQVLSPSEPRPAITIAEDRKEVTRNSIEVAKFIRKWRECSALETHPRTEFLDHPASNHRSDKLLDLPRRAIWQLQELSSSKAVVGRSCIVSDFV